MSDVQRQEVHTESPAVRDVQHLPEKVTVTATESSTVAESPRIEKLRKAIAAQEAYLEKLRSYKTKRDALAKTVRDALSEGSPSKSGSGSGDSGGLVLPDELQSVLLEEEARHLLASIQAAQSSSTGTRGNLEGKEDVKRAKRNEEKKNKKKKKQEKNDTTKGDNTHQIVSLSAQEVASKNALFAALEEFSKRTEQCGIEQPMAIAENVVKTEGIPPAWLQDDNVEAHVTEIGAQVVREDQRGDVKSAEDYTSDDFEEDEGGD